MRRLGAVSAALASILSAAPLRAQNSSYEDLQRFSAVLNFIRTDYVDSVTYHTLVRAAIDGMLSSLDPHSWFASRDDAERLTAIQRGEVAVTGISIELVDGVPVVLDVTDGSPADRGGVRPGDRVVAVDSLPTTGMTAQAVELRLAGDKGTRIRVGLERGPVLEPDSVTVTLKREMPKPASSVRVVRMLDSVTGYVRLAEFGERSARDVHDAIKHLRGQHARRLILDLRGNPGGIVTEAVQMASQFFPAQTLVFTTRGRQPSANKAYRTTEDGDFRDLPLVVLVDRGSASAAEALTGSLQDHDRAIVAGRRTFGKALMQTAFIVPDGMIMLTIGHVLSPSGRYIQRPYTGLKAQQYYVFAGDSAWQDTTRTFRTDHGRVVRAGGGIAPDVTLPAPPTMPRWFTVAADSGWDRAVADSVGASLDSTPAARKSWVSGSAIWNARVLAPFLARVRSGLGLTARVDSVTTSAIARRLAAEAAAVRWGDEARDDLLLASDPDLISAVALFARRAAILDTP
jgi:carboxyl-terminal processing protease